LGFGARGETETVKLTSASNEQSSGRFGGIGDCMALKGKKPPSQRLGKGHKNKRTGVGVSLMCRKKTCLKIKNDGVCSIGGEQGVGKGTSQKETLSAQAASSEAGHVGGGKGCGKDRVEVQLSY